MTSNRKIGRYEVTGELGRGGMATVFQAFDPQFKRDVAIKVLPREFLHQELFRVRFLQEATTVASLEHPSIVPVYDFGDDAGQPYLVMRFMKGGQLGDRIRKGRMNIVETAQIIGQLAPALDYAHQRGIVHRDLKPDNIMFDEHGQAYLTDFGIAKLTESTGTLTGDAIIGTPAYMSPEQARGDEDIDGRSDIYSMGVIVFEMLAGVVPYQATSPMGQAVKHITDPVPNIQEAAGDLPYALQVIIEKVMSKNKHLRFQTAREFANALRLVAGGEMPDSITDVVKPTMAKMMRDEVASIEGSRPTQPGTPINPTAEQSQAAPTARAGRNNLLLYGGLAAIGLVVVLVLAFVLGRGSSAAQSPTDIPPTQVEVNTAATQEAQLQQTQTVLALELEATRTSATAEALAALATQSAQPTPEPTPTSIPETEEPGPTASNSNIRTSFSEDEGFFNLFDGIRIENDALFMGPFEKCALDVGRASAGCLAVCTACGFATDFSMTYESSFVDGRPWKLFGVALRFLDEDEDGIIDPEDYFLGWAYSVAVRSEFPEARWTMYEHLPNATNNPWVFLDSEISNLPPTPRLPSLIRIESSENGKYIEIYMNDVRMIRFTNETPKPGEKLVRNMPQSGFVGFWVVEKEITVKYENFRFEPK